MAPAQQRFGPRASAGLHVDSRLIGEAELVWCGQRFADADQQGEPALMLLVLHGRMNLDLQLRPAGIEHGAEGLAQIPMAAWAATGTPSDSTKAARRA